MYKIQIVKALAKKRDRSLSCKKGTWSDWGPELGKSQLTQNSVLVFNKKAIPFQEMLLRLHVDKTEQVPIKT